MSRPITDIRRRGCFLLPLFQHRTNRVLRTPHKNARHLRDLQKSALTIEVLENAATKPNRHPQVLPALRNSAPASYTGLLVPSLTKAAGFNHLLVGRHERRLEEVLPHAGRVSNCSRRQCRHHFCPRHSAYSRLRRSRGRLQPRQFGQGGDADSARFHSTDAVEGSYY